MLVSHIYVCTLDCWFNTEVPPRVFYLYELWNTYRWKRFILTIRHWSAFMVGSRNEFNRYLTILICVENVNYCTNLSVKEMFIWSILYLYLHVIYAWRHIWILDQQCVLIIVCMDVVNYFPVSVMVVVKIVMWWREMPEIQLFHSVVGWCVWSRFLWPTQSQ